jgi:hypothetical protein
MLKILRQIIFQKQFECSMASMVLEARPEPVLVLLPNPTDRCPMTWRGEFNAALPPIHSQVVSRSRAVHMHASSTSPCSTVQGASVQT